MRTAAIDVGSNTLRLLIGEMRPDGLSRIHAGRAVTRLAEGIGETGLLGEENMEKSLSVLKDFSRVVERHGAKQVRAVGTSALRDAENSREFLDMVARDTGIRIEIIEGVREAELTISGILVGARDLAMPSLIVDIGGGSTEWILHGSGSSRISGSLHLGVVDLFERFVRSDPPSLPDITVLIEEVDAHLRKLRHEIRGQEPPRECIGTGGTITTLAAMDLSLDEYDPERVHLHRISPARLSSLQDMLISLPIEGRQGIKGLEPGRADLIIPGILLTIRFVDFFGFPGVTASDFGLLEGLIKEMNDESGI